MTTTSPGNAGFLLRQVGDLVRPANILLFPKPFPIPPPERPPGPPPDAPLGLPPRPREPLADLMLSLERANPGRLTGDPLHQDNQAAAAFAYELRRRGQPSDAKPQFGLPAEREAVEAVWGGKFTPAQNHQEIERAFREMGNGARGFAFIRTSLGATMLNVENLDGNVYFMNAVEATPEARAAFDWAAKDGGDAIWHLRTDQLPLPPKDRLDPYVAAADR